MKYKVIISPEAEVDLKEAFSWYEDKRTGLGYDFLLGLLLIEWVKMWGRIHRTRYTTVFFACLSF
jgi:hypothetical protein